MFRKSAPALAGLTLALCAGLALATPPQAAAQSPAPVSAT